MKGLTDSREEDHLFLFIITEKVSHCECNGVFLSLCVPFSLFGCLVCPFGIPGTTELTYLNPRNIHIPRYHKLSVGTGLFILL